jgi:MFS family permease
LLTLAVFETYYESGALFNETSSNISWIGSIQAFLLLFLGSLSGPIFDRGYLRALVAFGTFSTVFGYMMLSLCKSFWAIVLAQGFLIGIGGGCLFIPAVAVLPGYFRKNLGLAVGIATSGSSLGGVIYPIVFYRLIDRIGFAWTTRVLGFMALGTLLLPLFVMKQRIKPAKARALIDWTAFNDTPFVLFIIACFFGFSALYTVLFYISYFGASTGISDNEMSFYVVPILNAASVFGRTLPNWVSDTTGGLNLLAPASLICAILIFCMIAVKSLAGFIIQAVLLGFFSGVFIALPPVLFAQLTKDKTKIGTRIGMGFCFLSLATLVGGPGTGGVLGKDPKDLHWRSVWIYGGVIELAGGCIYFALRMWVSKGKLLYKI